MTKLKKISIYNNETTEREGFVLTYKDRHITEELIRPSGVKRPAKTLFKYSYQGLKAQRAIKKLIDNEELNDNDSQKTNDTELKEICLEAHLRLLTQFSSSYSLVQKIKQSILEEKYNGDAFQPVLDNALKIFKKLNQKRTDLIQYVLKNDLYDIDRGIKLLKPEPMGASKAVFYIDNFYVIFKPIIMRDMEFKTHILNTSEQTGITPDSLKSQYKKRENFFHVTFNNVDEVLRGLNIID